MKIIITLLLAVAFVCALSALEKAEQEIEAMQQANQQNNQVRNNIPVIFMDGVEYRRVEPN